MRRKPLFLYTCNPVLCAHMSLSAQDVFTFLSILAVLMVILAMYHLLFILVDLRKMVRRFEDITQQVEAMILKPISMADQILAWIMEQLEHKKKKHHDKKEIN